MLRENICHALCSTTKLNAMFRPSRMVAGCLMAGLLLSGLATFVVTGCRSAEHREVIAAAAATDEHPGKTDDRIKGKMDVPPYTVIEHGVFGAPSRIKGENLADQISSRTAYQAALKHEDHREMTFLWLERYRRFLKLSDPRSQLRIEGVQTDRLGSTHIKLRQVVDALPVWNRTVVVHYNQDHDLYLFQGDYVPSSTLLNVDTGRAMPVSEAATVALAAVSEDASQWKVEDSFMVIHTAESRSPRPAHVLILSKGLMERYRYIVDALNGDILGKSTLVRTGMQPMQLK